MAVLMLLEIPGATLDRYDRLNEAMGLDGDADAPDGLIQHVAGADGDTLVICDVWESEDAGRRFSEERVKPAMADIGAEPGPPPRILPVHNMLRGAGQNPGEMLIMEMPDLGVDTYDAMTAQMSAHEGGGSNHGSYSHVAAPDGDGLVVVDVWGSAQEFADFSRAQIEAAGAEQDVGPIEPRVVPVHNVIRGQGG